MPESGASELDAEVMAMGREWSARYGHRQVVGSRMIMNGE